MKKWLYRIVLNATSNILVEIMLQVLEYFAHLPYTVVSPEAVQDLRKRENELERMLVMKIDNVITEKLG